jgi:hypothetical protein
MEIVDCAAAVLGKASQKFSSMAPGLLGAVIDSVADDSDGKTAERALIITQDVKDMLNNYNDAQFEEAEKVLQVVTAELLLLSKAAMAKLAAAGSFTKDQRDKMIEKFGADSEAAVNAAMSIATAAKMAAAFMYGLDVPDFNDFMPAGGESMWSDVRKVFEKAEIGIDWGAIPDVKPAVFQTFVTIGKMKAADILKTLTEAIKHKTPCPGVTTTAR